MTVTAETIKDYIVQELGGPDGEIEDETLLFSTGLLDSFSLVDLITHIEGLAGLKISPTEVTLDHFDTIGRMVRFLENKNSG